MASAWSSRWKHSMPITPLVTAVAAIPNSVTVWQNFIRLWPSGLIPYALSLIPQWFGIWNWLICFTSRLGLCPLDSHMASVGPLLFVATRWLLQDFHKPYAFCYLGPFSNLGLGSVSGFGLVRCIRLGNASRPSGLFFFEQHVFCQVGLNRRSLKPNHVLQFSKSL